MLQLLIQGLSVGFNYALVCVGFAIIYSATRTFHFAHGAIYAAAAYAYYSVVAVLHLGLITGIVASLMTAGILGVACDRYIYRPMRRSSASFLTMFAASFGLLIIVTNALVLIYGSGFYSIASTLSKAHEISGIYISGSEMLSIVVALAVILIYTTVIRHTKLGTLLRAIGDDNELLSIYGFSNSRYATLAFLLGSLFVVPAAISGLYMNGLQPEIGTQVTLIAIAGTIIGGIGSLRGAALAGILLGVIENLGVWVLPSVWKPAISFGVLLLFIIFRPHGIFFRQIRKV